MAKAAGDVAAVASKAARLALAALSDLASPKLAQTEPEKMTSMRKEPKGSALGRGGGGVVPRRRRRRRKVEKIEKTTTTRLMPAALPSSLRCPSPVLCLESRRGCCCCCGDSLLRRAIVSTPASGPVGCVFRRSSFDFRRRQRVFFLLSPLSCFSPLSLFLSSPISHPLHPRAKRQSPWMRRQRRAFPRRASCCCPSSPKWPASMSNAAVVAAVVVAVEASRPPGVLLLRRWGSD